MKFIAFNYDNSGNFTGYTKSTLISEFDPQSNTSGFGTWVAETFGTNEDPLGPSLGPPVAGGAFTTRKIIN